MQTLNQKYIYSVVKKALQEDLEPLGDITTQIVKNKNTKIKAKIIAKQSGVIAGLNFCKTAFKLIGNETIFSSKVRDGSKVKKGTIIAIVRAKAKTILTAERTALNFLNHTSGIATITNQFVKMSNKKIKICCTRKTTPNLRLLEKYAVRKGGGFNHRFNLSDEILIKENHINLEINLKDLVKRAAKTKNKVTVEVENINQLKQIIGLRFKRILFDNMSLFSLKKCLKLCKNKYETEFSGNVNLNNIKKIASSGVDRVSIGYLTHSAKTFDTSLIL